MKFKPAIQSLIVIHTAMLVGQLLFAAIIYFVSKQIEVPIADKPTFKVLQSIVALLSVGGGFAAFAISKQKIKHLQISTLSFEDKVALYRPACIIKYALLEGPALFCLIGYLLTHNISFFLLFGVLLLIFAGQKPTVTMMMYEMNVSREELMQP